MRSLKIGGGEIMDAREFYARIENADDELNAVSVDLDKIFRDTDHLQHIFSDLAEKAAEIEDEDNLNSLEADTLANFKKTLKSTLKMAVADAV